MRITQSQLVFVSFLQTFHSWSQISARSSVSFAPVASTLGSFPPAPAAEDSKKSSNRVYRGSTPVETWHTSAYSEFPQALHSARDSRYITYSSRSSLVWTLNHLRASDHYVSRRFSPLGYTSPYPPAGSHFGPSSGASYYSSASPSASPSRSSPSLLIGSSPSSQLARGPSPNISPLSPSAAVISAATATSDMRPSPSAASIPFSFVGSHSVPDSPLGESLSSTNNFSTLASGVSFSEPSRLNGSINMLANTVRFEFG